VSNLCTSTLSAIPNRLQITALSIKLEAGVIIEFTLDADVNNDSEEINLKDYAKLAAHWIHSPCHAANNWCEETLMIRLKSSRTGWSQSDFWFEQSTCFWGRKKSEN